MKIDYIKLMEKYATKNDNHIILEKVIDKDQEYYQVMVNGSQEIESQDLSKCIQFYNREIETGLFN